MHSTEHHSHLHRCPTCAAEWLCGRADCLNTEVCYQCDVNRYEHWLEDHGYEPQRTLALTAEEQEQF